MAKGLALSIGINHVDPAHYGSSMPLNACESDARAFDAIARKQGFASEVVLSAKATRKALQDFLRQAARDLKSGDILLLAYSGHGGQLPDLNHDEADFKDETWCLFDGQFSDDELYAALSTLAEDTRVLIFSDSCHSGTMAKTAFYGALLAANLPGTKANVALESPTSPAPTIGFKFLPPAVALQTYERNKSFYDGIADKLKGMQDVEKGDGMKASVRLISGCQDNQYSMDGIINSAFTAALLRVWFDGRFRGDYSDFHRQIQELLEPTQSPNHYKVGKTLRSYDRQKPFTI